MSQDNLLPVILQALVLPPGLSLALLFLALLSHGVGTRRFFLLLGFGSLFLASIPVTANWLMGRLEVFPPVALDKIAAEAIVVLGAERHGNAPEYGGETTGGFGLERLRYAASLGKMTGLPILISGGDALGKGNIPEAELMQTALKDFGIEARWLEDRSRNTYENALFSSQILKGVGIGEVLLVTQGFHMPRAVEAFEKAGMRVVPAPTGLMNVAKETDITDFLPSASALRSSSLALHELLGRWWYQQRYYRGNLE